MRKFLFCILFCIQILFGFDSKSHQIFLEIQNVIKTMKKSSYSHHKNINSKKGIYISDCSTFVAYIVGKVSPRSLMFLPIDKHHRHPRAKNFYTVFEKLSTENSTGGWLAVGDMAKAGVGDIIAWKFDLALKRRNTGHVVIIYKKPVLEKDGLYRVTVLDSSRGIHANDSRIKGVSSGVGIGTMWFRVDKKGKPIGLFWSNKNKKESKHLIAIARVVN